MEMKMEFAANWRREPSGACACVKKPTLNLLSYYGKHSIRFFGFYCRCQSWLSNASGSASLTMCLAAALKACILGSYRLYQAEGCEKQGKSSRYEWLQWAKCASRLRSDLLSIWQQHWRPRCQTARAASSQRFQWGSASHFIQAGWREREVALLCVHKRVVSVRHFGPQQANAKASLLFHSSTLPLATRARQKARREPAEVPSSTTLFSSHTSGPASEPNSIVNTSSRLRCLRHSTTHNPSLRF